MTVLSKISTLGEGEAHRLLHSGILTTDDLLRLGRTARARKLIAAGSGISPTRLLRLVHMADLLRVKGIGWDYAEALDKVGVHSLTALSVQEPSELFARLEGLRNQDGSLRHLPTPARLSNWIEQARQLPSRIAY